ncbi:hypothetical protein [Halorussus sp. MSC15.2]|uniref:hypothetical protein n=1 Tax=Halorussus sp. MSC15.2 TaxID=2283638 RepID=UPI0013D52827|nr:hypothetical protein [Halorussus sp. MSC15.2]NEU58800.1 hypothetical protein [Halorussus sp. MSC15.2]
MTRTLELPNGDTVTSDDVFLYNDYPYRVVFPGDDESPNEDAKYEFWLSPLHWGGGEMDIPFREREALVEQWGPESRGTLTESEWEGWLREARGDDRFGDDELDALARELPTSDSGLVTRLRRTLGF